MDKQYVLKNNMKNGSVRVQIVPSQPKTLSHLPTRPP
ncbi:AGAP009851-PA, partial [Anopheles gambiae str. PEST]